MVLAPLAWTVIEDPDSDRRFRWLLLQATGDSDGRAALGVGRLLQVGPRDVLRRCSSKASTKPAMQRSVGIAPTKGSDCLLRDEE